LAEGEVEEFEARDVGRWLHLGGAVERLDEVAGLLEQLAAAVAPGLADGGEQLEERPLRVVRAAVEGTAVGSEEHRHGPAAVAVDGLDGVHVDGIDVGPLLAVDLDAHEPLVHGRRHLGVLEALVGHDVTPVAGRVPHREEDRLVLGSGLSERLVAPRVPVDRVVAVLAKVGRRLAGEPVHLGHATDVRLVARASSSAARSARGPAR